MPINMARVAARHRLPLVAWLSAYVLSAPKGLPLLLWQLLPMQERQIAQPPRRSQRLQWQTPAPSRSPGALQGCPEATTTPKSPLCRTHVEDDSPGRDLPRVRGSLEHSHNF